jgi:hypothetical protein
MRDDTMRDELHHLVDQLPDTQVRPVLELVRDRVHPRQPEQASLSFIESFDAESDFAERSEEILRAEFGR